MNVASLELSKELYELSGWDDTSFKWEEVGEYGWDVAKASYLAAEDFPAYDLGFLLRKLPPFIGNHVLTIEKDPIHYYAGYIEIGRNGKGALLSPYRQEADTPEDAVAKLAIELFKSGVLK